MAEEFSFENVNASDFKLIKDMTKEELIKELTDEFMLELDRHTETELKAMVMHSRLNNMKKKLLKEAGFKEETGLLGNRIVEDE